MMAIFHAKGAANTNHHFEGEVVVSSEKGGYSRRFDSETMGKFGSANVLCFHQSEHLISEVELGAVDLEFQTGGGFPENIRKRFCFFNHQ